VARRKADEQDLLASCYRASLALAAGHALASIAFSAISTGRYAFPADLAARIAVGTVAAEIAAGSRMPARVIFCCFSGEWPKAGHWNPNYEYID
jgi:O-acetyl-ADP-ribose deacetylase (regulator of RNase III)